MALFWIRTLLLRELKSLAAELNLFPQEDEIWATLPGVANSTGNLTLHVCGNLQHYIGAVLGESGYVRDRPLEFSARGLRRVELLAEIEKTAEVVGRVLAGLEEAKLEETYPDVLDGHRPPTGLFLAHLCSHLAFHLGQVGYLRRISTGEDRSSGVLPLAALVGPESR
jgi:hypothetical protein